MTCPICRDSRADDATEVARVRSNVRRFETEQFTVWRCASCQSLNSLEAVDLDHYYRDYPLNQAEVEGWALQFFNRIQTRRLRSVGLRRDHRILDYGCGVGVMVAQLRRAGFERVAGYDRFEAAFSDERCLEASYDAILLQDVIEHVEDPPELLERLGAMLEPGGKLCIATPNASEIDLADSERFIHSLHQPYHRHIFSESALVDLAGRLGFRVEKIFRRYYMDLPLPILNIRFMHHYVSLFGNTLDVSLEPIHLDWRLLSPKSLALALFGWLSPVRTELMVVLEKRA